MVGSIAFGLGGGAESVNDNNLKFEVDRINVNLISYDFVANKIIFKANIPETYDGIIYEMGLYNKAGPPPANSKMVTAFDSTTNETWLTGGFPATFTATNSRIGGDALSHTPSASTTATSTLSSISLDFSQNLSSDIFSLAYYNTNSNVASMKVRFKTDASNYYETTITSPATGYVISSFTKGAMTVVGTPNWNSIKAIDVVTTSGAGASNVAWDGIRIDDSTYGGSDYILVSRELLSTPFTKQRGKVQEVEYSLDVSV